MKKPKWKRNKQSSFEMYLNNTFSLKTVLSIEGIELVVGEDIDIIDKDPVPEDNGYRYTLKAISEKAKNLFK